MSPPTPAPTLFEVGGPLPVGRTTLLEASAGTGKTYALTALAVRFVAEHGIPIDSILLVTFTRAATAELRERIRTRLVEAAAHLDPSSPIETTADPLLAHLADATPDERATRRALLERAVRDYDTATIVTIHGFCSQVRASLGVLAEQNPDAIPTQSEAQLIRQVASDLIFSRASLHADADQGDGGPDDPAAVALPKLDDLCAAVAKARTLGECEVRAESGREEDLLLVELVDTACDLIDERLRRTGSLSFDSLVAAARDAVRGDPDLVATLRDQYRVALIDEFQDTDPAQWELFRTVFADDPTADAAGQATDGQAGGAAVGERGRCTLVLVGDPKQAIYAFRGGDVYTYLAARGTADRQRLGVNHRSDASVVDAMNALADGQAFGEPEIAYERVGASPLHDGRSLQVRDQAAPGLDLRLLLAADACGPDVAKLQVGPARKRIAADLAEVAVELLRHGIVHERSGTRKRLTPGDLAVLLPAKAQAQRYADALEARGIPVILRMADNVADSPAATQWRSLLHALDRPASTARVAAVALGWCFEWTPERIAAAVDDPDDRDLLELQHQLVGWAEVLGSGGVAALFGEIRRTTDLVPNVLRGADGERNLTDLEHLAELLSTETHVGGHGRGGTTAAAASAVLDDLGGTAVDEVAGDAVQRRIESEADAVQVMTIHASKGLEFPVVLLPELWSPGKRVQAGDVLSYFDQHERRRALDLSSPPPPPEGRKTKPGKRDVAPIAYDETRRQNCGDQHRLTYVALTRAVHQAVVWWTPSRQNAGLAGLTRMLAGVATDHPADKKAALPTGPELADQLRERFQATPAVRVTELAAPAGPTSQLDEPTSGPAAELTLATLGRPLQRTAHRWSFSGLSRIISSEHPGAAAADASPADRPSGSDPHDELADDRGAGDEPRVERADNPADLEPGRGPGTPWSTPSPFDGLGAGVDFGNLVHHLLEVVAFDGAEPEAELAAELERTTRYAVSDAQRERLPAVLAQVLRTPLGDRFGGVRLADLDRAHRLDELAFHLPLAPDDPAPARRIGTVVRDHLDAGDPLAPWAERLATGLAHIDLQGYLNGAIDLVLAHGTRGAPRFSVVDYKTNQLGAGPARTLADYHPDRLHLAMAHHHYALQCLIYSVALHRFLRWRLAGYDPDVHLGPVGYLFVRGMVGPDTPVAVGGAADGVPAGVFTWDLPSGLVPALSDVFAGAVPA